MTITYSNATHHLGALQRKDVRIQHAQRITALAWAPLSKWPFGRHFIASADAGGMVLVSDSEVGRPYVHLVHQGRCATSPGPRIRPRWQRPAVMEAYRCGIHGPGAVGRPIGNTPAGACHRRCAA